MVEADQALADRKADGVARAEELDALTRQQLLDLLGRHQIRLRPVIDLNQGMRRTATRCPRASTSGSTGHTSLDNLGKLVRRHHRIKTHGGWQVRQRAGRFYWTSPHGRDYVTDGRGTRELAIGHRPST